MQSKKSNRAVLAGWLRYAPQAPATAEILHRLRRNWHDPRLLLLRYGSPLRTAGYREAST